VLGLWTLAVGQEAKPSTEAKAKKPAAEGSETAKSEKEIEWQPSYEVAMTKAKEAGKPVMIDFYTDWCSWCKVLDQKTYTDPEVIEAADKMVAVKIDAEAHADLAKKYKVNSYPRIVFLSSEGKVIHEIMGYKPPDQFLPDMKAVLQGKSPKELAAELAKKGTDDPEQQLWIGMVLLDEEKNEEAIPWLEKAVANLPADKKAQAQRVLPFVYLEEKQTDKAKKAFEDYKNNPKVEPEDAADTDIRFSYQLKDRERMEAAIDRLMELTKSEGKKSQLKQLKASLDRMLPKVEAAPAGGKPASDQPKKDKES